MQKINNWWIFTKERFDPLSHLIMIVVFLIAHILVINAIKSIRANSLDDLLLFIGVTAFYFKLRLYDEVKDYELDVVINKNRPLPRGLLSHQDMFRGMVTCIVIEILCFSVMGVNSVISLILAIAYSLLMYKEFFIKDIIRPHLTTYALMHTIVTSILSFAIFSFLSKESLLNLIVDKTLYSFAILNWLLFNIFEFGRKTFATVEERDQVDTYSSLFGRWGAALLVVSQALVAHYLSFNLVGANKELLLYMSLALFILLLFISVNFIVKNSSGSAKFFRHMSSGYIILFYLIIIISHISP